MRKGFYHLLMLSAFTLLLTACQNVLAEETKETKVPATQKTQAYPESGADSLELYSLSGGLFTSYYKAQNEPAYEFFRRNSVQRFLAGWVKEATGDIAEPVWDFDSFTKVTLMDHDFTVSKPDEALYCCNFSDGNGRYGYAVIQYFEDDSAMSKWSITETTPYIYDLWPNRKDISEAAADSRLDLETAGASRVILFGKEQNLADQAIYFTDDKGGSFIYYFENHK